MAGPAEEPKATAPTASKAGALLTLPDDASAPNSARRPSAPSAPAAPPPPRLFRFDGVNVDGARRAYSEYLLQIEALDARAELLKNAAKHFAAAEAELLATRRPGVRPVVPPLRDLRGSTKLAQKPAVVYPDPLLIGVSPSELEEPFEPFCPHVDINGRHSSHSPRLPKSPPPACSNEKCRKVAMRCVVCNLAVKGLSSYCVSCGHGGHTPHIKEWFASESVCPTGCGCVCSFDELHSPRPLHSSRTRSLHAALS